MLSLDLRGKLHLSKQDCEHFPHMVDISDKDKSGVTSNVRSSDSDSWFGRLSRQCLVWSVLRKYNTSVEFWPLLEHTGVFIICMCV